MIKKTEGKIQLTEPSIGRIVIPIEGISSLLQARRTAEMIKKGPKTKDEFEIFSNCLYPKRNGKYTHPGSAFRKCMVQAANTTAPGFKKAAVKGFVFIPEEYIEIEGSEPAPRKDVAVAKNKFGGSAIEVIRAEFMEWKAKIPIEYDLGGGLSLPEIVNLLDIAGHTIGVGAWRPEKGGVHGRFRVERSKVKTVE